MKKPIYKKWWFWVLLIIVLGGIGNMGNDTEATDQAVPTATVEPAKAVVVEATAVPTIEPTVEPTVEPTEQPIPGTIGMTPAEFRKTFNNRADSMKSDIKISTKLAVENGLVQDSFQFMLTDHLGLTGTVNKADGSIRDVMLIGQGDGTVASGANIMVAMGLVILAANPDLPSTEVGTVLAELHVLDDGVDLTTIDESTIRNGIRYHVSGSDSIGLMFSAGDANEK